MLVSLIVVVVFLLYKRYKLSSKYILFWVSPLAFSVEKHPVGAQTCNTETSGKIRYGLHQ